NRQGQTAITESGWRQFMPLDPETISVPVYEPDGCSSSKEKTIAHDAGQPIESNRLIADRGRRRALGRTGHEVERFPGGRAMPGLWPADPSDDRVAATLD